jgi:hypothetical protein
MSMATRGSSAPVGGLVDPQRPLNAVSYGSSLGSPTEVMTALVSSQGRLSLRDTPDTVQAVVRDRAPDVLGERIDPAPVAPAPTSRGAHASETALYGSSSEGP